MSKASADGLRGFAVRFLGWMLGLLCTRRPHMRVRLCIVKCDRMGDFILAVSTIRLLLAEVPEHEALLVCHPSGAGIAAVEFPGLRRVVLPDPGRCGSLATLLAVLRQWACLRGIFADRVVCLRHQRRIRDELALRFIRTSCLLALPGDGLSSPLSRDIPAGDHGMQFCGELMRHRDLAEQVMGRSIPMGSVLPVLAAVGVCGTARADGDAFALVAPLAGHGSESLRNMPSPLVRAGIAALHASGVRRVFLCGLPVQRGALRDIAGSLHMEGLLVEILSARGFAEMVQMIRRARMVLTADSASAHIAAALDRPMVAVLGGGHPGQFAPWSRSARQVWLTRSVECAGCNWRCPFETPRCITEIPPEIVADGIHRALAVRCGSE